MPYVVYYVIMKDGLCPRKFYDSLSFVNGVHYQGVVRDYLTPCGCKCIVLFLDSNTGNIDDDIRAKKFYDKYKDIIEIEPPDNFPSHVQHVLESKVSEILDVLNSGKDNDNISSFKSDIEIEASAPPPETLRVNFNDECTHVLKK